MPNKATKSRNKCHFMSLFKDVFGKSEQDDASSKVAWRQLTDLGELNVMVSESAEKPVLLFKHSTRCAISRMVLKQFERDYNLDDAIIPYFLDLLQHRDISNEIANRFEVQHQSPQVIVIKEGKTVYNASHESINVIILKDFI
jgi:bacillithiol system protein YtxJ